MNVTLISINAIVKNLYILVALRKIDLRVYEWLFVYVCVWSSYCVGVKFRVKMDYVFEVICKMR